MKTGEMRTRAILIKPIEGSLNWFLGGIAELLDFGFSGRNAIRFERRDYRDEGVAHGNYRSNRRVRWSGNGPAHFTEPTDFIPRLNKAPTRSGI
jgi:hypothetical protein